jgi:SpoVK/Ycf46/Vps4 family AAA+-type ATPase
VNNGANLLLFGPPGGGKSHLAAALGFALVASTRPNFYKIMKLGLTDEEKLARSRALSMDGAAGRTGPA